MAQAKERILEGARHLITEGRNPTVAEVAGAAGVSRSSFYRLFKSREALLEQLEIAPEPGARERIVDAALQMVGATGLAALSMDDLADRAGVSRATLYRLFPGKTALFTAVVYAYSPLEPVTQVLTTMQDEPPAVVMPEVARAVFRTVFGAGESRAGLLRAVFYEVSNLGPDAEEAVREVIGKLVASLGLYVTTQMSAGHLRQMHPLLALQSFIGPIFFHLMTRQAAERVLGFEVDGEQAVTELAETWLRAMVIKEGGK